MTQPDNYDYFDAGGNRIDDSHTTKLELTCPSCKKEYYIKNEKGFLVDDIAKIKCTKCSCEFTAEVMLVAVVIKEMDK